MERFTKPALVLLVVVFAALGINNIVSRENTIQLREVQLKSTTSELKQLQLEFDQNIKKQDELLHQKNVNQKELKKLRQDNEKKNQRIQELEQQVSLKQSAAKVAASVDPTPKAYAAGGSKDSWLAASGIPKDQWGYVDYIVSRESGWQPCAYYPGQNDCNARPVNACGLVQQNPCHKIPGDWRDPVAALKWQYQYVKDRYGGYAQAVGYWQANGHY